MCKIIVAATVAALALSASAASAATLRFKTVTTSGSYQNGSPDPALSDTTAAFSADIVLTSPTTFDILNGVFTDGNGDPYGDPEVNAGFSRLGESVTATSLQIRNAAFAELTLIIDPISGTFPSVTGTYLFGGINGEVASGSFSGLLTTVPLPSSAPLLGGALAALGAAGLRSRRQGIASA